MTKVRGKSFHFKKFKVEHDRCAMKVNTDAVVLGAYVAGLYEKSKAVVRQVLDIGTGTGIIALLLAQKIDSQFDALELNKDAYEQARDNFENSPWADRLHAIEGCFLGYYRDTDTKLYDLIISNPPFFNPHTFHKEIDKQSLEFTRAQARYDDALPFIELITGAYKLLTPAGCFFVIIPYKRAVEFTALAVKEGFCLEHELDIISVEKKAPKRVILQLRKFNTTFERSELVLHAISGNKTPEFEELTKDYYI